MQQFEKIIHRQGETLHLITASTSLPFKASLTESTKATYSVNNRANFFQGQSLKRTLDGTSNVEVGDYFTRDTDDNKVYFVMSTIPEPRCTNLMFMYVVRCNTKITITRYSESVDPNDETQSIKGDVAIATDVWANKDVVTRSMKGTNDGLLDQAIYLVYLPRKYGVKLMDKVCIGDVIYRVESINDILINADMTGGVDVLQLTYLSQKAVQKNEFN